MLVGQGLFEADDVCFFCCKAKKLPCNLVSYIFGVYVSFILKERVSFKHPGRLRIAVAQKRTADLQKIE